MTTSLDLYRQAHQEHPEWWEGMSVWRHIARIRQLIQQTGATSLLDYGCGKGKQYAVPVALGGKEWPDLATYWGLTPWLYDPAVPEFADLPKPHLARLGGVICTDVLEHAENVNDAWNTLTVIFDTAEKFVFLSVACTPAGKFLADGRNAHTLVREPHWWAGLVESLAPPGIIWKLVCSTTDAEHIFTSAGINRELGTSASQSAVPPPGTNGSKPIQQRIVVHARNCVPHDQIIHQVMQNQDLEFPVLEFCHPHGRTAVLVSGGPSWTRFLPQIQHHQDISDTIVCVKSSHDYLIAAGIIPYACILLDPRDFVVDFVANPHPGVRYFVATMVHESTLRRLKETGARVFLYHAAVGAGEEKVAKRGVIVSGGSCAATRAIPILHTLGYRKFEMYGYDSCYSDEPPAIEGYESAHKDDSRVRISVGGKEFLTDNQLIAQSQDFEGMWGSFSGTCSFNVHGDGMVATVFEQLQRKKLDLDAKRRDISELLG